MFKIKSQEKISESLEIAGGFGIIGTFVVGATTLVGETLDQAGVVDGFSGSVGAKYTGVLALYAATSLIGQKLFESK